MSRLLQDLLTFSRVATSAQPLRAVAAGDIVHAVLSDLQDQIGRTGAARRLARFPASAATPPSCASCFRI